MISLADWLRDDILDLYKREGWCLCNDGAYCQYVDCPYDGESYCEGGERCEEYFQLIIDKIKTESDII